MKKKLLAFFLFAFNLTVAYGQAQQNLLLQDAGNHVMVQKYVDIKGSPFYNADWQTGTLTLMTNKVYKDMSMKYDEVADKVYIKAANDGLILLNDKVKEFALDFSGPNGNEVKVFRLGYSNIPDASPDSYFEVLIDGKAQLLKKITKIIQENREYNSASSTKTFIDVVKYYIFIQGNGILIKRDKKSILKALSDKQPALETYIKENNLNLKAELDIKKLLVYYNSL